MQRINGEATQQYLRLPIAPYFGDWGDESPGGKGPPKLTMGATFEFQGYETGGFVGIPADAYRRAGLLLQTCDHYFRSVIIVLAGSRTESIQHLPAEFVGREALLEGTARNKGAVAIIEGSGWEITLDGPPWPSYALEKRAEALGTIRKTAEGSFRLDAEASGYRALVKLEDQLDREVTLRGTAWNINGVKTFDYRGESLRVEPQQQSAGEVWPHGDPVSVTGYLQRLPQPQMDAVNQVVTYTIMRATWQRTGALLIPETNMTNPR